MGWGASMARAVLGGWHGLAGLGSNTGGVELQSSQVPPRQPAEASSPPPWILAGLVVLPKMWNGPFLTKLCGNMLRKPEPRLCKRCPGSPTLPRSQPGIPGASVYPVPTLPTLPTLPQVDTRRPLRRCQCCCCCCCCCCCLLCAAPAPALTPAPVTVITVSNSKHEVS